MVFDMVFRNPRFIWLVTSNDMTISSSCMRVRVIANNPKVYGWLVVMTTDYSTCPS